MQDLASCEPAFSTKKNVIYPKDITNTNYMSNRKINFCILGLYVNEILVFPLDILDL